MMRIMKLKDMEQLTVENVDLSDLSIFTTLSESLPKLASLTLNNAMLSNLDGLTSLKSLEFLTIKMNKVSINDPQTLVFLAN